MKPSELQIDIGTASIKVAHGPEGKITSIPLERDPSGIPTPSSRAAAVDALRDAANGARRARVALPAYGVSVRRFAVPKANRDTTGRVLALQMEQSFPISPDSLAWGYRLHDGAGTNGHPNQGTSEAVVVAVRRDRLDVYESMVREAGLEPRFTVGTLAASALLPTRDGLRSVLDIGAHHTELLTLHDGQPSALRTIAWGGARVTEAVATATGFAPMTIEASKPSWDGRADEPDRDPTARAVHGVIQSFATAVRNALGPAPDDGPIHHVHLSGGGAGTPGLDRVLASVLGPGFEVHVPFGGTDAIVRGLNRVDAPDVDGFDFLSREESASIRPTTKQSSKLWPWAVAASVLIAALLAIRYLPAMTRLDGLEAELAQSEAALAEMPSVDRELAFFRHVESAQPPTWETITAIAHVAPPGAVLKVLRIKRNLSLDLEVQIKPGENNAFRKRLVQTGWFANLRYEGKKTVKGHDKKPRSIVRYTARLTRPTEGLASIADELKTPVPDPATVKTQSAQPKATPPSPTPTVPAGKPTVPTATKKPSSSPPKAIKPAGAPSSVIPTPSPESSSRADAMRRALEGKISGLENVPEAQRAAILERLSEQMKNQLENR